MNVPEQSGCRVDARFSGLWPRADAVTFHPTTLEERTAFAKLIPALLAAAPQQKDVPPELTNVAAAVGFFLETWTTPRDTFWVLRERPDRYHGAGAYVIRTGEATNDVVQVPHPYFDIGTEDIGASLFVCPPEGRAPRLFMTATAHRYKGTPGETPEDPEHPADVAHNPEHLFQTVTDLAARNLSAPRVVQLHGFGETKVQKGRRGEAGGGAQRRDAQARKVGRAGGRTAGGGAGPWSEAVPGRSAGARRDTERAGTSAPVVSASPLPAPGNVIPYAQSAGDPGTSGPAGPDSVRTLGGLSADVSCSTPRPLHPARGSARGAARHRAARRLPAIRHRWRSEEGMTWQPRAIRGPVALEDLEARRPMCLAACRR